VTRPEPAWLGRLAVDEAHFRQIREHGGTHGLRDENALESALARPRWHWHYASEERLAYLAAEYAYGLIKDHPYFYGNQRLSLFAMVAFMDRNGMELTASNAEALSAIFTVAAGAMTEGVLADWVDARCRSL
jgi:death-on-curing protein